MNDQTNIGIPVLMGSWYKEPLIQFAENRPYHSDRRTAFLMVLKKPREQWLREEWPNDVRNLNPKSFP